MQQAPCFQPSNLSARGPRTTPPGRAKVSGGDQGATDVRLLSGSVQIKRMCHKHGPIALYNIWCVFVFTL